MEANPGSPWKDVYGELIRIMGRGVEDYIKDF